MTKKILILFFILMITAPVFISANNDKNDSVFSDSVGKGEEAGLNFEGYEIYFLNESDISKEIQEDDQEIREKEATFDSNIKYLSKSGSKKQKTQIIERTKQSVGVGIGSSKLKIKYSDLTGTPQRIIGEPIKIDQKKDYKIKSSDIKESSLDLLEQNEKMLNIEAENLKLINEYSNERLDSFTYKQYYEGIPIWSSEVGITIKDKSDVVLIGSNYFENINIDIVPSISPEEIVNKIKSQINFNESEDKIINISLYIFPLENKEGAELHLTWKVDTFVKKPVSAWSYFIDAHTGDILFKYNNIIEYSEYIWVEGTAQANIYPENTMNALQTKNLDDLYIYFYDYDPWDADDILGDSPYLTDSIGFYETGWIDIMTDPFGGQGEPYLISYLKGPYVKVLDDGGDETYHYYDLTINPLTARIYNFNFYSGQEQNVFYHVNRIHDYFKNPPFNFNGMDYQMIATVNYGGSYYCNAFYSPSTGEVAFGKGDPAFDCGDLSLDSDVIYHEYTHGVVDHIYNLPYYGQSGAISEALADYYATTINGNSIQGEGTFPGGLRNLDNDNKYPDDWVGEVHDDSLIISGAFWDMRKSLGKDYVDYLIFQAVQLSPHAYDFEEFLENLLLVDDDDSNLNDGTPNDQKICNAFKGHGITSNFCNQVLDCTPTIVSYPFSIEEEENASIIWNNPCDTTHTNIHYCSPSYNCYIDNAEFFSAVQSGSAGDYTDKLSLDEEGDWYFFIHSTAGGDYYSNIKYIDVRSKPKVKIINTLSDQAVDNDGDGLYNNLIINIPVNVTEEGIYEVDIDLKDKNDTYITWAYNRTNLSTGLKNISVPVDGKRIRKKAINGPYTISSIWIYDEYYDLVEHQYPNYNTSAYGYLDFQKQDLSITDTYNSFGTDTNNNGLFEYFTVDVGLIVNKEGYYNVYGYLTNMSEGWCDVSLNLEGEIGSLKKGNHYIKDNINKENYGLIYNSSDFCSVYNEKVYLNISNNSVFLNFEGDEIRSRKLTGPLYLRYIYLEDEEYNFIDSRFDPYNTSDYNYSKFEKSFECTTPYNSFRSPFVIENDTILCKGEYNLPEGIKIISNNTVLDCNGAKIIGDDSIWGIYGFINYGGDNVTVKNCYVDGYSRALMVEGGNSNFFNNTINNSITGIEIGRGDNNKVFDNKVSNVNTGIWIWSENSDIFNNKISNAEKGILFYVQNKNNRIYNNNISSSVYTIDLDEDWSGYDGVDNYIWNNNLYNSPINYKSRYNNKYCVQGVGNNYYDGAYGPECDLYCDINYNEEGCTDCKYPRRFIGEDITLCKGEYYFPEGIYLNILNSNITLECKETVLIGNKSQEGIELNLATNVTLKNCSFTNYSSGIYLIGADNNNKIYNNKLQGNSRGIWIFFSDNNSIENNFVSNNTYAGIDVYGSNGNKIMDNEILENNKGIDITAWRVKDNYVVNNSLYYSGIYMPTWYELPDENIYCEGKQGNYYYGGATGPICDLVIKSPKHDEIYTDRRIEVEILTPFVNELFYSDNGERDRRLCKNCKGDNKKISFQDGEHNLSIKGMKEDNLEFFSSVNFFIDSKDPRISKIEPRRNTFTNGTGFYIKVREENPKNITVSFNPEIPLDLDDCTESRGYYECYITLNLTGYDGQEIEYYFIVEDIAGHKDESKKVEVKVDTTSPVLNNPDSFWERGEGRYSRYIYFDMSITEKNFDEAVLNYDYRGRTRETKLCSRLKNGRCEKRFTMRDDYTNLKLIIRDEAGNLFEKELDLS